MLTFKDEDVRWKLQKQTGTAAVSPVAFHAFSNLEERAPTDPERKIASLGCEADFGEGFRLRR